MKIILPARDIRDGTKVTKVNGTKEYTLVSRVEGYDENGKKQILADFRSEGIKFLLDDRGDLTIVKDETELVWTLDRWELLGFLDARPFG